MEVRQRALRCCDAMSSRGPFRPAGTFRPAFAFAAQHNFRLVALNLRDYPGSTPFSAEELADLCSSDVEKQRASFCAQGLEVATFLKNFIVFEQIPPCLEVDGRREGGVVLFAWSIATIHILAMLGNEAVFPDDVKTVLNRSLRTCVLYGQCSGLLRYFLLIAPTQTLHTSVSVCHSPISFTFPQRTPQSLRRICRSRCVVGPPHFTPRCHS